MVTVKMKLNADINFRCLMHGTTLVSAENTALQKPQLTTIPCYHTRRLNTDYLIYMLRSTSNSACTEEFIRVVGVFLVQGCMSDLCHRAPH